MAKKNPPAISVIIPMFNTEAYVAECLTSLANQTFQDFEIIVADDCSTDNSRAVVKSFLSTFGDKLHMMKLSKNSTCAAVPRNFALKEAVGKYVYFLDSDDFLTETALEDLYNVAEKFDADVVHTEKAFKFDDERGKDSSELFSLQTGKLVAEPTLETSDTGERVAAFIQKRFTWWACDKLFRRKFLLDNKIAFPLVRVFEDFVFTFKCIVAAKNYVRVPFADYYYRIRKDSASHRKLDAVSFMSDVVVTVTSLDSFMRGRKFFTDDPQLMYLVLDFFVQNRLDVFSNKIFLAQDHSPGEVYDVLYKKIFSVKPKDNVALTSYLFVTANILRLYLNQQAAEINELKNLLKAQS